ncbi:TetR/AcrR family transcriptional regulator [Dyadobacter sp. 32]|uniref:TetR/AcrR family transcriptional regulator n=1 Tax=Dyadobacter sp. 32 TaxID=538966 RepID=UPI0011F02390
MQKEDVMREKVLGCADRLFQKFGLFKTTMEDIAREAGKGKSTLYHYFKSKEDIFGAILTREKDAFFEVVQNSIAKETTARRKIEVFYIKRFEAIRKVINLYNVLLEETRCGLIDSGQVHVWRKQYDAKELNIIKSILQYGIVTGEFRVLKEHELDGLAFIFASAQRGVEMDLVLYDKLDEMERFLNLLVDLAINGLKK